MSFANEPSINRTPADLLSEGRLPLQPVCRRFWRTWFRGVLLVILVVCAIVAAVGFVLWRWFERERAAQRAANQARLATVVADLDQREPGWRLPDLEAARKTLPDAENSALRVRAAAAYLPKWYQWPTDLPNPPPPMLLNATDAANLDAALERFAEALKEARSLADLPEGRFPNAYPGDPYRYWKATRHYEVHEIGSLLHYDSQVCAQRGDVNQALRSCRALVDTGRSIGDEPSDRQ